MALRFEPLQVDAESDMVVQPVKFEFGAPLVRRAVPEVLSANRQIGCSTVDWLAIAALLKVFSLTPFTVVSPA